MSNILIQEIIDIIDGVTNAHSGDLNSTVYLQEMRDAILQVSGLKPGSLAEVVYLQQIRNAILGVADGQFGNLPARVYLQEIRDAYNGIAARAAYIAACSAVATSKGTKYVDVYAWMVANGGDALIGPDDLHPNDAGHAQIAAAFLSVL